MLATYRAYADALVAAHAASTPGGKGPEGAEGTEGGRGPRAEPLYYSLDMARFLNLSTDAWEHIGFRTPGRSVPGADLMTSYLSRSGPGIDPIVVVYEHQFPSYQAAYRAVHGVLCGAGEPVTAWARRGGGGAAPPR